MPMNSYIHKQWLKLLSTQHAGMSSLFERGASHVVVQNDQYIFPKSLHYILLCNNIYTLSKTISPSLGTKG